MNNIRFALGTIAILSLSAYTAYESTHWDIADGYSIEFVGDHPSGVFTSMEGNIVFDENDLSASNFNVKVDVNSINTGNGMRNKHAKGKSWFNVKQYPNITFVSSKIAKTPNGYAATGMLNMAGNEREIVIPFSFDNNYFNGGFTVNRMDYNIGTTKGMKGKASNMFVLNISVPVTQK